MANTNGSVQITTNRELANNNPPSSPEIMTKKVSLWQHEGERNRC
jgi:hypothetical protein